MPPRDSINIWKFRNWLHENFPRTSYIFDGNARISGAISSDIEEVELYWDAKLLRWFNSRQGKDRGQQIFMCLLCFPGKEVRLRPIWPNWKRFHWPGARRLSRANQLYASSATLWPVGQQKNEINRVLIGEVLFQFGRATLISAQPDRRQQPANNGVCISGYTQSGTLTLYAAPGVIQRRWRWVGGGVLTVRYYGNRRNSRCSPPRLFTLRARLISLRRFLSLLLIVNVCRRQRKSGFSECAARRHQQP